MRVFSKILTMLILSAALTAGCQTITGTSSGIVIGPIESFKVIKPIGLFDVNARRAELKADPELAKSLCIASSLPANVSSRAASAIEVVGHGTSYTIFNQPKLTRGMGKAFALSDAHKYGDRIEFVMPGPGHNRTPRLAGLDRRDAENRGRTKVDPRVQFTAATAHPDVADVRATKTARACIHVTYHSL